MAQDFGALNRKLSGVLAEFDGTASRKRLEAIAKQTAKDVDEAVHGDLRGDNSMSGWTRRDPIKITGTAEVVSDSEILVQPVKPARGPLRVLEQGRNMGNASGFSGPGVSADGSTKRTKNGGLRKVRGWKSKRWNGYTKGKDTWSDAVALMESRVTARVEKQLVESLRRHLGRG